MDRREERFQLRLTTEEREMFEQAKRMLSLSTLSEFIRKGAQVLAEKTFEENDHIFLANEDRDLFLNALENPPPPTPKFQEAWDRYKSTQQ